MCNQCKGLGLIKSFLEKVVVYTICGACDGLGRNAA